MLYIFITVSGISLAAENTGIYSNRTDTMLDSVIVTGVDSLLGAEITGMLLSGKGGIFNDGLIEYDVNAVTSYLNERGWWKAHVSVFADSSGGRNVLTFEIVSGYPVLFGLITYEVSDYTDTSLPQPGSKLYGTYFSKEALETTTQEIISYFAGNGYPDVAITPSLNADSDTAHVALKIAVGRQAHVDSVVVRGLTRTRDYVIRRELASLRGLPAGPDVVREAGSLLDRLHFVRSETPFIDYDYDGNGALVVSLTEGSQGSFDGVLGYQPSPDGDSGEMVGRIDLGFDNLFGTGRSSRIRWENLGEKTEDMEVTYTEPWVFGFPYNISGSFMQEERELRGYIKTILSANIGRYVGKLHVDGGFQYEKVSADTLHSSKAAGVNLNAKWNAVINPINPYRGILYRASWSTISKRRRFGSRETTRLERLEFDLDHYIPTFSRQTVAILTRYRHVKTPREHLAPSDRYWIGGASNIRGYSESMFPALRALWTNIEYRFITGETSRVFFFIDAGHLENSEKSDNKFKKENRSLIGYGFGLRLRSRAGMLGFDYGLGRGDSPGDGKLHVRVSTEF